MRYCIISQHLFWCCIYTWYFFNSIIYSSFTIFDESISLLHASIPSSLHSFKRSTVCRSHPVRGITVTRHQGTRSVKAGKCEAFTFAGSFFNPHLGRAPEFHVKQTQLRYTKIIKASLIRFLHFLPNLSPFKTVALPGPNALCHCSPSSSIPNSFRCTEVNGRFDPGGGCAGSSKVGHL